METFRGRWAEGPSRAFPLQSASSESGVRVSEPVCGALHGLSLCAWGCQRGQPRPLGLHGPSRLSPENPLEPGALGAAGTGGHPEQGTRQLGGHGSWTLCLRGACPATTVWLREVSEPRFVHMKAGRREAKPQGGQDCRCYLLLPGHLAGPGHGGLLSAPELPCLRQLVASVQLNTPGSDLEHADLGEGEMVKVNVLERDRRQACPSNEATHVAVCVRGARPPDDTDGSLETPCRPALAAVQSADDQPWGQREEAGPAAPGGRCGRTLPSGRAVCGTPELHRRIFYRQSDS
uniref:Uncharacterized protein n=1 Tax=Rangifer tarandus platyrhynchus TaxID=3082113 RepID=A0ACB0F2P5_RANTA|nr:unnamed protein product [Rangifer tarandus platyrhynchus]